MTLIHPESVVGRTLPNGLRVLVRRDATAPVTAIVTYVTAGYFDETDDVIGIAHVLEHMYFKGTASRGVGEIARQTKAAGGYLNAATIYDHTLYYAVVPSSGFRSALEIQADAFRNSLIDERELGRELEVIIEEAKRKADNPAAVAVETLHELLYDRHRIRRWRIGREEGLRRLRRDDLVRFYRNFYQPSNTVLVVVGDVEVQRAFDEVARLYGDIPAGQPRRSPSPAEERDAGFRYRELSGDVAQTQIVLGWRTPGTMHADTAPLDLLAVVLAAGRASRLYRAVRERQLVSSIIAYNYTPREIGVFVVHGEAPPDRAASALDATWDQLRRVRTEGIGTIELARARRITESRWLRRLEDMEGQANYLAEWEALGNWELGERYYERMMATSSDELVALAERYLRDDQASILTYRPQSAPTIAGDANALRARLRSATAEPLAASPPLEIQGTVPGVRTRRARRDREEAGVFVYRLDSGVPILVKRREGSSLTYAGVFALGGPSLENMDIAGRTLLMARTAVKGTASRTAVQIAEAGEMLGGSVGASVGSESVGWSISVPTTHVAAALELLADVAQQPTFRAESLETERAIALADLATLRDDMYRYPMRLAMMTAFAGHPYGVPSLGSPDSLRAHGAEQLRHWHRDHFLSASAVIGFVSDADPDDLAELAARHFEQLRFREPPGVPPVEWPEASVEASEQREKAQTAMVLAWPAPLRADPSRFDLAMLAGVASGLGGRFFEELRDKQSLCYTVQAAAGERRAAGTFHAYIATSPEKEAAARSGLLREIEKLRDLPVTAEELDRAKTYAIGVHQIRQQSGGAVLGEIIDAWMYGALRDLEEFPARVRAVTAAAIRDTARKYLDPARRVEGIVRGVSQTV
jgi:zinc protease